MLHQKKLIQVLPFNCLKRKFQFTLWYSSCQLNEFQFSTARGKKTCKTDCSDVGGEGAHPRVLSWKTVAHFNTSTSLQQPINYACFYAFIRNITYIQIHNHMVNRKEWEVRFVRIWIFTTDFTEAKMLMRCTSRFKLFSIFLCSLKSGFSKNSNWDRLKSVILFIPTAIYKAISRIYQDIKLYQEC